MDEVNGITTDNATTKLQLVADTTSTNDFVALKVDAGGVFGSDISVSTTKTTAATETRDSTALESTAAAQRVTGFSKYYVATVDDESDDNVSYAPISDGAIGTAVNAGSTTDGHTTITDVFLADGGSTTLMAVVESDNVSVYTVGASSLTLWNDNLTSTDSNLIGADNSTTGTNPSFAVSPNGDRAVFVGFYDNGTSIPLLAALSPTAVTRNGVDNLSYNIAYTDNNGASDNRTGHVGKGQNYIHTHAATAWCNDGSAGGALWLAMSADNMSGFTFSKWADNGTSAATDLFHHSIVDIAIGETASDNTTADNITSMSMACDPDDYMPVLGIGYDASAGDVAMAKFDNNTNTWEKLFTDTGVATAYDPVTVSVSSDGSVFALGYAETSTDNATIKIFYDE
jgi:hypothetical protein